MTRHPDPTARGSRGRTRSRLWVWGPAWAAMALIFALSAVSSVPPAVRAVDDRLWHGLGYGLLAALVLRALAAARWQAVTGRTVLLAIAVATLYGVTDELHQWFVPGRTAQWSDLVADATGAAVACGALWAWQSRAVRERADAETERTS